MVSSWHKELLRRMHRHRSRRLEHLKRPGDPPLVVDESLSEMQSAGLVQSRLVDPPDCRTQRVWKLTRAGIAARDDVLTSC